ncbi:MAG: helix-turn-helix domain-containing protein [Lachnospiraceae bacterium]|nr:helix-turn-helix domain-containing protein [Lachnospiraceae bacterium]
MSYEYDRYDQLARFIAQIFGRVTSTVLYDLNKSDMPVAAAYGYSGLKEIGKPMEAVERALVSRYQRTGQTVFIAYAGRTTADRDRHSALIIESAPGRPELLLEVIVDISDLRFTQAAFMSISEKWDLNSVSMEETDTDLISVGVEELVEHNLKMVCPEYAAGETQLGHKKKMEVVSRLYEMGTFRVKGAVSAVASRIGSSVPTVYRYLNILKKDHSGNL